MTMKKKSLIIIPIILIGFWIVFNGNQSNADYEKDLKKYWKDKHDFFEHAAGSPFVQKKIAYKKIEIFPPNQNFKIKAKLDRFTSREIVTIGNSDGSATNYLKFAKAQFEVNGTEQSILILKALGFGNQYLTAFGDETSGVSTYGGGRYLDLDIGKSDWVELDFNKAYNPYCAYFEDYSCPLPPVENLLTVAINAGEKNYPH